MNEKHKLMKPKDPARSGRQASRRAKKWQSRLSAALLCTLLFTVFFSSCRDEDFAPSMYSRAEGTGGSTTSVDGLSGLTQNEDGTWIATRRVPLVGIGRVINNISRKKLEVIAWADDAKQIVDTDLENSFSTSSAAVEAELLASQIVSVVDQGHVYAAGQKVGFVIQNEGDGLLDLSVLKGFGLRLYLDGKEVAYQSFMEATNVADLGVGNITGGTANQMQVVEMTAPANFDEVLLEYGGVDVDVANAKNLIVYYAYVGENPVIPAVNNCAESPISSAYFHDNVAYMTGAHWSSYAGRPSLIKLIDDDLGNGIGIETISSLFQPYMAIDFGQVIPAGSEVGFYITNGALLNLSIGGTTEITTYLNENDDDAADNYTLTNIIGLQLLGGGASYLSIKTTKPCRYIQIQFWGINANLGVTEVHYAFVREKTEVDVSSYFNLSDAVVYTPNYRFPIPQELPEGASVEFISVTGPSSAELERQSDGSCLLTGMNTAGDYVVKAVYNDGNGRTMTCQATITRLVKDEEFCSIPLTNKDENDKTYRVEGHEGFKGVVIGGSTGTTEDLSNVIDNDLNNYIEDTDININLIENSRIVGVYRNEQGTAINQSLSNGDGTYKKTRVGFVINRESPFLGLQLLKFLRIKTLFNGDEQEFGVGEGNNGISLGLIQAGDSSTRLACLSIETEKPFDAVELYYTGLAGVELGHKMQVYYAFYEDATKDCANPGEKCMQLITNANYNAIATYSVEGLATALTGVGSLSNIVDADIESACDLVDVLNVGIKATIGVTFDPITIKGAQEIGFILSAPEGLLDLDLISVKIVNAYLDGNLVGTSDSGGALSLKVAGIGEKQYLSIVNPNFTTEDGFTFDKLELVLGSGVDVASTIRINGVYFLPDYDGDGVVDCVEDEASTEITGLSITPADICVGDAAEFRVTGGIVGRTYQLEFKDQNNDVNTKFVNVTINNSGSLTFDPQDFIPTLPAGEYLVSLYKGTKDIWNGSFFNVHSEETTWCGTTSEWDEWSNWTNGTPWSCTNVIIPSRTDSPTYPNWDGIYPHITSAMDAKCNYIHFEPGAELVGQQYLDYSQAFVDARFKVGSYQLVSVPLQGMVTGDMFIQQESRRTPWQNWRITKTELETGTIHPNYFIVINDNMSEFAEDKSSGYEEYRVKPSIYQRFWNKAVSNRSMSRAAYDTEVDPALSMTDWSRSFNAVSTGYDRAQGFALRISEDGGIDVGNYATFHFPKDFSIYKYYTSTGQETGTSDAVPVRNNMGRLMISGSLPETIILERELDDTGNLFIFGNPFMAHINIEKLFEANEGIISNIKVFYNGEYVTITKETANSVVPAQIAPMQAVVIEAVNAGAGCEININDNMLEQGNSTATTVTAPNQLRLTATSRGHSASCVVVPSSAASDDYDAREDATLLVGSEEGSGVAVYTVAGGKALSIQRMNQSGRIPVGFYLKEEGNVTLSFDPQGDAWRGWNLVDQQTGKRYPLDSETNLGTVKSGAGRFYLERTGN